MTLSTNIDVLSSCIAAKLYHAAALAKSLSLTAKNAQAITLRGGDNCLGFKALTVFINEFAETIISQAIKINDQAVIISRLAIRQAHTKSTYKQFNRAWAFAGDNSHREDLEPILLTLNERAQHAERQILLLLQQLEFELDECQMQMRASLIIATTSKTEASRAGEYENSLFAIASNIETTSTDIRSHLHAASTFLRELKKKIHESSHIIRGRASSVDHVREG
jgi:hypothetical protein